MNAPSGEPSRLVLHTSGGFTGPAGAETRTVELALQPAARAAELKRLAAESNLFALPAELRKPHPQSWDFEHTLQVEADGRSHTVRYHLDAAPPALRQLTEALMAQPPDN